MNWFWRLIGKGALKLAKYAADNPEKVQGVIAKVKGRKPKDTE